MEKNGGKTMKPKLNDTDTIEGEIILRIKQKNTEQPSYLFCDRVEYLHNKQKDFFDHHLMVYNKGNLIFKVWLPNNRGDKEFKNINEALKSVGIILHEKWVSKK